MDKTFTMVSTNITPDSVVKYSNFVGIICILMIFINIWFMKELVLKIKVAEKRLNILYLILAMIFITIISMVILFLAINCFLI